jgi:hypothetical protein
VRFTFDLQGVMRIGSFEIAAGFATLSEEIEGLEAKAHQRKVT